MSIDVDPDWWKTMFDEVYLITDARSVCDEVLTCREVDVVCELLPLESGHRILDLCGGHGRHTFELYKRGFTECTLLDYSQKLIDVAEAEADANRFTVEFVRADARSTDLTDDFFDHVIIMGNSMGYILTNEADIKILAESYRILRPGGWLLVDVTDSSVVKDSFCPNSWHEIGDNTVVCRKRELHEDVVKAREMVIDKQKGLIRDRTYAIRLYDSNGLESLFRQAGFNNVNIYTNFSPHQSSGDCGFMNNRMIGIGQKV
ncbi:MAG: class I SAM-dependent methyltransferase [Deltaproteobacteria bacterium]|jgi:D-alanine-D-alanine ligase|nr:class I SAM-dependent methyltransferase [Deltaproteobacteria bacterium]